MTERLLELFPTSQVRGAAESAAALETLLSFAAEARYWQLASARDRGRESEKERWRERESEKEGGRERGRARERGKEEKREGEREGEGERYKD